MATRENWEEILQVNRTLIQMLIDLDNGLCGEIKKRNIFSQREMSNVWPADFSEKRPKHERVDSLLEMLEKKFFRSFQLFCEALEDSGQQRLIKEALSEPQNYESEAVIAKLTERVERSLQMIERKPFQSFQLLCEAQKASALESMIEEVISESGNYESEVASDSSDYDEAAYCCLTVFQRYYLKHNWNNVIDHMTTNAKVFGKLLERKVFTDNQIEGFKKIQEESHRNETVLLVLEKSSEWQFNTFCDIMHDTKQLVVEEYLRPKKQPSLSLPRQEIKPTADYQSIQEVNRKETSMSDSAAKPIEMEDCAASVTLPCPDPPLDNPPKELIEIQFGVCSPEFRRLLEEKIKKQTAYRCDRVPRGRAIIINNQYFSNNLPVRRGAQEDGIALQFLFTKLQFDTQHFSDLTAEEIMCLLKVESEASHHKNFDMFVLFLLSHGRSGEIFGRDVKPVSINSILTLFDGKNCPSLKNKPKLFFVQACQGDKKTQEVKESDSSGLALPLETPLEETLETSRDDKELAVELQSMQLEVPLEATFESGTVKAEFKDKLQYASLESELVESFLLEPCQEIQCDTNVREIDHELADMLIAYCTVEGFVAYRNTNTGSFFVRCILEVFSKRAHEEDLQSMLTEVYKKLHDNTVTEMKDNYKQIGEKRDTLRRKVYLLPGDVFPGDTTSQAEAIFP